MPLARLIARLGSEGRIRKPIIGLCGLLFLALGLLAAAEPAVPSEATRASATPNAAFTPQLSFEQRTELACENPVRAALPLTPSMTQALALWAALFALAFVLGVWAWQAQTAPASWPRTLALGAALLAALTLYAAFLLRPELHMGAAFLRNFRYALMPDPAQSPADALWLAYWRALLDVFPWRAETLWRAHAALSVPALLLCLACYRRLVPMRGAATAALVLLAFSAPLLFGAGSDLPLVFALIVFAASMLALEALFGGPRWALAIALPVSTLSVIVAPFLVLLLWPRALAAFFETPARKAAPKAALLLAAWALGLLIEASLFASTWPKWHLPEFGLWLPLAGPSLTLALVGLADKRRQARLWAWFCAALLSALLVPLDPGFFKGTLLPDLLLALFLSPLAVVGAYALAERFAIRPLVAVPLLALFLVIPGAAFVAERQESFSLRLYRFESAWLDTHRIPLARLYRADAPGITAFPDFLLPRGRKPCLRPLSTLNNDPAPKGPRFLFVPPECMAFSGAERIENANCLPWQRLFATSELHCLAPFSMPDAFNENACLVGLLGPRE